MHGDACRRWLLRELEALGQPAFPDYSRFLTAMAEFALASVAPGTPRPWAESVASILKDRCDREKIAALFDTTPESVTVCGWLSLLFLIHEIPPPVSLDRLQRRLHLMVARPVDSPYPLRRLEAAYLLHRLGHVTALPFSWPIRRSADFVSGVYELTHAAFYLSDFAANGWPVGSDVLRQSRSGMLESLRPAIRFCEWTAHLDLSAEVALAGFGLGCAGEIANLLDMVAREQDRRGMVSETGGPRSPSLVHQTLAAMLAFDASRM